MPSSGAPRAAPSRWPTLNGSRSVRWRSRSIGWRRRRRSWSCGRAGRRTRRLVAPSRAAVALNRVVTSVSPIASRRSKARWIGSIHATAGALWPGRTPHLPAEAAARPDQPGSRLRPHATLQYYVPTTRDGASLTLMQPRPSLVIRFAVALVLCAPACGGAQVPNTLTAAERSAGWQLLFNGVSLDGWKASDKPGTFSVANGQIVVRGPTSHLFYLGPVQHHDFTDFELRLDVMTYPGANSGVYFHTEWQEKGWPEKGYEVQVNNSHADTS